MDCACSAALRVAIKGVQKGLWYRAVLVDEVLANGDELSEYFEVAEDGFTLNLPAQDYVDVAVPALVDINMQVHLIRSTLLSSSLALLPH